MKLPALILAITALCLLVLTIIMTRDWAVVWSALSAIATFSAAAIALWLPFHQDQARRQEEMSAKRDLYWDIFFEIERALRIFAEAEGLGMRTAQSAEEERYRREVRDVEERSMNSSKVLQHLLRRNGIADGVIRRALDAIDLNKEVARSVHHLYDVETHEKGGFELEFHSVRRDRVLNDIDVHKTKLGLPRDLEKDTVGA